MMSDRSRTLADKKTGWIYEKLRAGRDLKNWHGLAPLVVFLALVLPTGLYLVFNVPAMWAPDGGAHVARVFQIAHGRVKPVYINHQAGIGYGGSIPVNVNDLKIAELNVVVRSGASGSEKQAKLLSRQDKQQFAQISNQKISKQKTLISFVNSAAYSPIAYAPQAFTVIIGTILNFSLGHTLLLAGLAGFLTFILCAGYALFTLRNNQLKWAVLAVSLLPVVVFHSTVITADSFLASLSILFSALIIKSLSYGSKINILDKILLFGCVVALPQAKSVYSPLIFLVLLIPKDQWSNKLRYWLWAGLALVLSMLGFGIWSALTADVAASNGLVRGVGAWQYGDAKIQQSFILHHPLGFLHLIANSFLYQSKFYMDTFFGWLGFTYVQIPGVAEVAGFLALGLSLLLAGTVKIRRLVAGYLGVLLAFVALLMFAVFFVAFTPPSVNLVEGLQGRYFIPMTILIIVAASGLMPNLRISDKGADTAKAMLISLSAFCLLFSILRYGLAIAT